MDITIAEFVERLYRCHAELVSASHTDDRRNVSSSGLTRRSLSLHIPSLLHYGHLRGWLEDQDERQPQSILVKRTAARILHQFMRIELNLSDVNNISSADILQDLYTCRTCVNHVAQVYLQGLMESEEEEKNGSIIQIFNMMKPVTAKEAEEIFRRLHSLYSN